MTSLFDQAFNGDGSDYTFVTSHTALSGIGVEQAFEGGQWVLTQRDGTRSWTVRSTDHIGAVLLLIAARCGLTWPDGADFTYQDG